MCHNHIYRKCATEEVLKSKKFNLYRNTLYRINNGQKMVKK